MKRAVIISLDTRSFDPRRLERCARLAAALDLDLQALLVEDQDLLTVASLPFTREVVCHSARLRELSPSRLKQQVTQLSEQVRSQLQLLQLQIPVRWEVLTDQGQIVDSLRRHWQHAELFSTCNRPATNYSFSTYGSHRIQGVMLIHPPGDAGQRALAVAMQIARQHDCALDVITLPGSNLDNPEQLSTQSNTLKHLHLTALDRFDPDQIRRRALSLGVDILVLPADLVWPDHQPQSHPLLELEGMQVILVR